MIRYSRTAVGPEHIPYIPSVVVVSAEVLKFMLNGSLEITFNPDVRSDKSVMLKSMLANMITLECLKLFVPALLYLIQNNLLFVALKNLSVPVYQVLNQGKLFTTAFFSRLLLNKQISYCQYFSLLMLAAGVVIVQQSTNKDQSSSMNEGNPWIGFLAVLVSCVTSGFSAVYFEKVLKQKSDTKEQLSVYIRNMQLAFWSIGLGAFPIFMTEDRNLVQQNGLFQGYTWIVMTIIIFQAITGLLVGFVMKYADSVLKGFATSVAVVLATILSIVFFNDRVNELFLVGATLVILAVRTYTKNPPVDVPSAGGAPGDSQPFYKKKKLVVGVGILAVFAIAAMFLNDGFSEAVVYEEEELVLEGFDLINSCVGEEVLPLVPNRFRFQNVSVKLPKEGVRPKGCRLEYMRSEEEWLAKQQYTTTCPSSVDVYSWLMEKVNCFGEKHALMVAYGELIHLLRDRALLHPDGSYIDDDFDTWVSVATFQMILSLEPYLWNRGWSIRVSYSCDNSAIFAQIVPVCGHEYEAEMGKVKDGEYPAIELYVMKKVWSKDKGWVLRDVFGGNSFPMSWLLPVRPYPFEVITPESSTTLNLQLPAQPEKILDCLYGNWHVFSSKHSRLSLECKD